MSMATSRFTTWYIIQIVRPLNIKWDCNSIFNYTDIPLMVMMFVYFDNRTLINCGFSHLIKFSNS